MARGPLTWQNVSAPNFRGSNALRTAAATQLQRGIAGVGNDFSKLQQQETAEFDATTARNNETIQAEIAGLKSIGAYDNAASQYGAEALSQRFGDAVNLTKARTSFANRDEAINTEQDAAYNREQMLTQRADQPGIESFGLELNKATNQKDVDALLGRANAGEFNLSTGALQKATAQANSTGRSLTGFNRGEEQFQRQETNRLQQEGADRSFTEVTGRNAAIQERNKQAIAQYAQENGRQLDDQGNLIADGPLQQQIDQRALAEITENVVSPAGLRESFRNSLTGLDPSEVDSNLARYDRSLISTSKMTEPQQLELAQRNQVSQQNAAAEIQNLESNLQSARTDSNYIPAASAPVTGAAKADSIAQAKSITEASSEFATFGEYSTDELTTEITDYFNKGITVGGEKVEITPWIIDAALVQATTDSKNNNVSGTTVDIQTFQQAVERLAASSIDIRLANERVNTLSAQVNKARTETPQDLLDQDKKNRAAIRKAGKQASRKRGSVIPSNDANMTTLNRGINQFLNN